MQGRFGGQPRRRAGNGVCLLFQSPEGVVLTVQHEFAELNRMAFRFQSPEGVVLTVQLRAAGRESW